MAEEDNDTAQAIFTLIQASDSVPTEQMVIPQLQGYIYCSGNLRWRARRRWG